MSLPLPANLRTARSGYPAWLQVALFGVAGAVGGGLLGLVAAPLVPPSYRASATLEFAQAPGTIPLSDASRDARIDGFVESARSLAPTEELRPERIGATNLIRLDANDASPVRAARSANALADALIRRSLADRLATIDPAGSSLEADLDSARIAAEQAEQALASFRSRSPPLAGNAADALVGTIRDSVGNARGEAAAASVRAAAANHDVVVSTGSVGQSGTASLGPLHTQRAELAQRVAQLSERFDPAYPPLVSAKIELGTLDRAISTEMSGLAQSAAADAAAARSRAAALGESLLAVEQSRSRAIAGEAELARLQRAADRAGEAYHQLETGVVHRRTERSMALPELRLVNRATPPLKPASPQRWLLAFFSALALGIGGALIGFWLRPRAPFTRWRVLQ